MIYLRFCAAFVASLLLFSHPAAADAGVSKVENEQACLKSLDILPADLSGSETLKACAEALQSETNVPALQLAIGRAFFASGDFERAEHWFRKAADAGVARGLTNLGLMYLRGHFLRQDGEQAFQLLRNAAEKGEKISQYCLAGLYWTGYGVSMDRQEAIRWLKRSADQGFTNAARQMGVLTYRGSGVAMDKAEGRKMFSATISELKIESRISLLTQLASYGDAEGIVADLIGAIRSQADSGDRDAQAALGMIYYNGLGTSANDSEALRWSRLAADAGNPRGQLTLGLMYRYGDGVFRNSRQAYTWTMKAANQNYHPAACRLAEMFRDGIGVQKSISQFKLWQASCSDPSFESAEFLFRR